MVRVCLINQVEISELGYLEKTSLPLILSGLEYSSKMIREPHVKNIGQHIISPWKT